MSSFLVATVLALSIPPTGVHALNSSVHGNPFLPSGWACIEKEGVDTLRGAYHDSLSGAFVRTEVALDGAVIPWVTSKAAREGVRSEERDVAGYRMLHVRVADRDKACEEQIATFLRGNMSWNLASVVCTGLQKERFAQLLEDLPLRYPNWPPPNEARSRMLDQKELLAFELGTSWVELRGRVGPPNDVMSAPEGGFVARYEIGAKKKVMFHFDRERRLTEVDRN